MSKEKFTPGPWRTRNGDENCPVIVKVGDTKRVIANVAPKKGDHNEHSGYEVGHCRLISTERTANIALIAAAPELYKALKEACYELCHQNGCADDLKCDYWDAGKEVCTNADGECFVQKWLALLALARGEEGAALWLYAASKKMKIAQKTDLKAKHTNETG